LPLLFFTRRFAKDLPPAVRICYDCTREFEQISQNRTYDSKGLFLTEELALERLADNLVRWDVAERLNRKLRQ
jgi:hypothetical protein